MFEGVLKDMAGSSDKMARLQDNFMNCQLCLNMWNFAFQAFEVPDMKRVRSAARALLSKDADRIPLKRKEELQQVVLQHFGAEGGTELLQDMLQKIKDVAVR